MTIIKLLLCFLFVSVGISLIYAVTNDQDAKVMLALREKWSNTPQSWGASSDPCGTPWEGITCDGNDRITKLNLTNSGLAGTFSVDIANLTELQILDISFTQGLTGPIPPSLGNLSKLTVLRFVRCSLTGSIPSELGNAAQLSTIILRSNNLSGEIPNSIGKLSNLQWLDLTQNLLTGPIPVSSSGVLGIDQLKKLEFLCLENNTLTGNLPSNINTLTALSYLSVANNNFTGPIPDLSGLVNLTTLYLSSNPFESSQTPTWISSLQHLKYLEIGSASLYGPVPNAIFSLAELVTVAFDNNNFNGTLDLSENKSKNIIFVDFENNKISGLKLSPDFNRTLILAGNPYCEGPANANQAICQPYKLP